MVQKLLETKGEESVVSTTDYTDAFHNFILSQKLTTLLGNFPEVGFKIVYLCLSHWENNSNSMLM